ncbi:hypothetical protein AX17_000699 [Amanita inopinata Kibby_2008]|nr:hypothetical protein AX17_000699 [Amanita inopinata Kibby_2008]
MDLQQQILSQITPGPLTPNQIANIRYDTIRCIDHIRGLEAYLAAHGGTPNRELEDRLFFARMEYRLRFGRIFRINDLPAEVLIDIFRYVVWSSPGPEAGIKWRLRLTWVCRRWRELAITDATIWNAIWFRDPPPFYRSFEWFRRAQDAALDVRINNTYNFRFNGQSMRELLNKLFVKLSQIRILIVVVDDWDAIAAVVEALGTAASRGCPILLERIELHRSGAHYFGVEQASEPEGYIAQMPLFGGIQVPSLQYLSLNGICLDWSKSYLSNLTTFDIRRIPLSRSLKLWEFRAILASSPNLVKLCFDGTGPQWHAGREALEPIHIPSLKILILAELTVGFATYIASQIHTPNVRDLTLMNLIGEDYTPLFIHMTPRFPQVRILSVYTIEAHSIQPMVRWLTSMPRLTLLRLAGVQTDFLNFFLEAADPAITSPSTTRSNPMPRIVCPNLSVLDLQHMDPNQVVNWMIRRQNLGVPIKKVYLSKELSAKMTEPQHRMMAELCQLVRLEYGVVTAEEDALMR